MVEEVSVGAGGALSRRRLAALVDSLPGFPAPKQGLEQYVTPGDIVATIAWSMYMRGELRGYVADLGCGTGRIAFALQLLGGRPICVELDVEAARVAHGLGLDVVVCDVRLPCLRGVRAVAMNPPFGVWRRGADSEFLRAAAELGAEVIYSVHKASTAEYVLGLLRELGYEAEVVERAAIPIPPTYRHHRKRIHRVEAVVVAARRASR